jgi:Tfp pilus assembly protein PilO
MAAISKSTSPYSRYLARIANFYQKEEVRAYTNLILSLFTISFFVFFAVKPTLTTIASLIKEANDQKEVSQRLDKKLENLSAAQEEYRSFQEALYLIDQALPETAQSSSFLGQIEILSQENSLDLTSVQTGKHSLKGESLLVQKSQEEKIKEKTIYPAFTINLSSSGSYKNIEVFLNSLMNLRRITDIKNLSINKRSRDQEELSLGLGMDIFYFPITEKD